MELLLADAFGVTRQDLVLDLVDGSGDGGQQLLPAHTEVLQEGGGRVSTQSIMKAKDDICAYIDKIICHNETERTLYPFNKN